MQVLSFVGLLESSALNLNENTERGIERLTDTSTGGKKLLSDDRKVIPCIPPTLKYDDNRFNLTPNPSMVP